MRIWPLLRQASLRFIALLTKLPIDLCVFELPFSIAFQYILIVKALVEALVGEFSGHCETSRRSVDSSSAGAGKTELI